MTSANFAPGQGTLSSLHLSLDALAEEFLPTMGTDELGERCVSLQSARQRLDGIIAVGVAEAERAGVAANAGVRTMAQYLASRTHASVSDCVRTSLSALGGRNAHTAPL